MFFSHIPVGYLWSVPLENGFDRLRFMCRSCHQLILRKREGNKFL